VCSSPATRPRAPSPGVRVGRRAWLPTLLLGGALFVGDERVLVSTGDPDLVPSAILLGALLVPLAFLVLVDGRRLPRDVPAGVPWTSTLLSGVVGTIVAGVLEFRTLQGLGALSMLGVGLIEESAKLVVPLLVLLLLPYRRPADGLLLGVASGAGFAAGALYLAGHGGGAPAAPPLRARARRGGPAARRVGRHRHAARVRRHPVGNLLLLG
jgi:protease PrsW